MAEELTQEEKDAAAKIDAENSNEKSQIDKIGDQLSGVSNMLKSHVEEKEKGDDDDGKSEEPKEIDYSAIVPEELAKSLVDGDDPEKSIDFIQRLTEGCNLLPQDMVNEGGEPFISEEMQKSLDESEEIGNRHLSGIHYAMQEANERTSVKDKVIMQTMSVLAKSVIDLHGIIDEMKKSMTPPKVEKKADAGLELPDLDDAADDPLTKHESGGDIVEISRDAAMDAVKKSFYGSDEDYKKQLEYCQLINTNGFEATMASIKKIDAGLIRANLD